jgi:hypothetical protein
MNRHHEPWNSEKTCGSSLEWRGGGSALPPRVSMLGICKSGFGRRAVAELAPPSASVSHIASPHAGTHRQPCPRRSTASVGSRQPFWEPSLGSTTPPSKSASLRSSSRGNQVSSRVPWRITVEAKRLLARESGQQQGAMENHRGG